MVVMRMRVVPLPDGASYLLVFDRRAQEAWREGLLDGLRDMRPEGCAGVLVFEQDVEVE